MIVNPFPPSLPMNRAQRRAASKTRACNQRAQRRSRARIERALQKFPKE